MDQNARTSYEHQHYMKIALAAAEAAAACGEIPVGAVLVQHSEGTKQGRDARILALAHNQRESLQNPLAHAELLVIQQAAELLRSWRLLHTTLYVTLEPCPMCAGAILQARIAHVVYGTADPKAGCAGTLYNLLQDPRFNHTVTLTAGILQEACARPLQDFFHRLRKRTPALNQDREGP